MAWHAHGRVLWDTTPETPIDGVRWHWASAPATGSPPCSSHASVAHTATRPSSQGPASALRFTYFSILCWHEAPEACASPAAMEALESVPTAVPAPAAEVAVAVAPSAAPTATSAGGGAASAVAAGAKVIPPTATVSGGAHVASKGGGDRKIETFSMSHDRDLVHERDLGHKT